MRQQANNTVPLVETDGQGGHVPYVRPDTTPTTTYPTPIAAGLDYLEQIAALLREIRDEARATRLAVQELANAGTVAPHDDYLDLARTMDLDQEEL